MAKIVTVLAEQESIAMFAYFDALYIVFQFIDTYIYRDDADGFSILGKTTAAGQHIQP